MTTPKVERRSNKTVVLEAIRALQEQEMPATPASIERQTGLSKMAIGDAVKELEEHEEIWRPDRGLYRIKSKTEASQPILFTSIPDGGMKVEKGDDMIYFTAYEWRQCVAPAAAGYCAQTVIIEHTHHTMQLVEMVSKLKREVESLRHKQATDPRQLSIEV